MELDNNITDGNFDAVGINEDCCDESWYQHMKRIEIEGTDHQPDLATAVG